MERMILSVPKLARWQTWSFFFVGTQGHPGNQLTDDWQDLHTSDLGGLEAPF